MTRQARGTKHLIDIMDVFHWIVAGLWIVWLLVWLISARGVKKDVSRTSWWRWDWVQMTIILLAALVFGHYVAVALPGGIENAIVQCVGVAMVFSGLGFSIWARVCLGRNWSNQPSLKEGHELITSGPYHFVRHPIYTGVLAAMAGSALAGNSVSAWIVTFILFALLFVWRIRVEEKIMARQFPNQYPEYKKITKAIVPFMW